MVDPAVRLYYNVEPRRPTREVSLAIFTKSGVENDNEYLLTIQAYGLGGLLLAPDEINWSYSIGLELPYSYITSGRAGSLIPIKPKLETDQPVNRLLVGLQVWKPKAEPAELDQIFGSLWFSSKFDLAGTGPNGKMASAAGMASLRGTK